MHRRRNDTFTCWLCDFGWILVVLFTMTGSLLLSKNYLQGLSSLQDHPRNLLTDIPSTLMVSTALFRSYTETPPLVIQTPTISPADDNVQNSGYINLSGGYALNYPTQWQGTELGTDIQFVTKYGAMIYVHIEPHINDINVFSEEIQVFPYDVHRVIETTVSATPARCLELTLPETSILTAISCFVLNGQNGYVISLTELDGLNQNQLQVVQAQFMDLLCSFRFNSSR